MDKIERFEDILVWQRAINLSVEIYKAFQLSNDKGFNDQIQRAAVSVSNNIAEGFERKSIAEFIHFLFIAKGSCGEVRSMLFIAKDLNKINQPQFDYFYQECLIISKMLSKFIKSIVSKSENK